jgi:transcriptional regulator with XRE-family HTH domain
MALGEILREARLKKRLTASEIASGTHMKVQTVEAIEHEDFRKIPAPLYCKGFIKLYAEFVGLDPDPLLHEYVMRFLEPAPPPPAQDPTSMEPSAAPLQPAPAQPAVEAVKPATAPADPDLFSYAKSLPRPPVHIAPQKPPSNPPAEQGPMFAPPSLLALPEIKDSAKRITAAVSRVFARTGMKTGMKPSSMLASAKSRISGFLREKQLLSDPRAIAVMVIIGLLIFLVCVSALSTMCAPTDTKSLSNRKLSNGKPPEHYRVPIAAPLPYTD